MTDRVLVSGGGGYIAGFLIRQLVNRGLGGAHHRAQPGQ